MGGLSGDLVVDGADGEKVNFETWLKAPHVCLTNERAKQVRSHDPRGQI